MKKLLDDENSLRNRLFQIIKKDPSSLRDYQRRIFFTNKYGDGVTLRNFLEGARKTTFISLLQIQNFVELNEK